MGDKTHQARLSPEGHRQAEELRLKHEEEQRCQAALTRNREAEDRRRKEIRDLKQERFKIQLYSLRRIHQLDRKLLDDESKLHEQLYAWRLDDLGLSQESAIYNVLETKQQMDAREAAGSSGHDGKKPFQGVHIFDAFSNIGRFAPKASSKAPKKPTLSKKKTPRKRRK